MKKADILYNMILLAIENHKDQLDKYENQYILHPLRVMSKFWDDIDCAIIAIGHDLLEDTKVTEKSILNACGGITTYLDAIKLLTKNSNIEYDEYINNICEAIQAPGSYLRECGILAAKVKIADMKDNMSFERSCGQPIIPDNKINKFPVYRKAYNKLQELLDRIKLTDETRYKKI